MEGKWKVLVEGKGGRAGQHKQVHNSHNQPALINTIVLVHTRLSLILLLCKYSTVPKHVLVPTRTNSHEPTATSVNLSMKWAVAILHDLVLRPVQ